MDTEERANTCSVDIKQHLGMFARLHVLADCQICHKTGDRNQSFGIACWTIPAMCTGDLVRNVLSI